MSIQPTTHLQSPTTQYLNMRSNSMYNITKGESLGLPLTKQPIIPANISFGKDTQAISFKAKPTLITQQSASLQNDQLSKIIPSSAQNCSSIISPNSSCKSMGNSAQKCKNQYSITATGSTTFQYSSTSNLNSLLNNSIGNTQQQQTLSYQYNQTRNRNNPQMISFNNTNSQNILHHIGDFSNRFAISHNIDKSYNQQKLNSQQAKENNDLQGTLNPTLQNLKQFSGAFMPIIQTNKIVQKPLVQSEKKTENISQPQNLASNQYFQNQAQAQTTPSLQTQMKTQEQNYNFPNMQVKDQIKDSTIQFITNSDLETELKDLAQLLKREREGSILTNNFLQTDRESQNQELKLEVELLKEQNELLRLKVDELTKFSVEYDKEQQLVLLEKNLSLQKSQEEIEHLQIKFTSLERAYQLMYEEYNSQRQKVIQLQNQKSPDSSESVDLQDALEKKVLYMEEKMREEEVQCNKFKLVVLKQEESIAILENIVREAKEAQAQAELLLSEEQTTRLEKETQFTERFQSFQTEISYLNGKIEALKEDQKQLAKENSELQKTIAQNKLLEEERVNKLTNELNIKIEELTQINQNQEKEITLRQEKLANFEREGLILSKNTNALSDKVLELQANLENKLDLLKENEKKLQIQIEITQKLNDQLATQGFNYDQFTAQSSSQIKSLQDQLQRANSLLDSSSVNFEVTSKTLIKEKEDALEKITKLNEEIVGLKRVIEEQKYISEDMKMKLKEQTSSNQILSSQVDKLRNDSLEQMRIFNDTQRNLNSRVEQLINENSKLQQADLIHEGERNEKFNQMFQQLQQEKLQLIQENKKIFEENITLSEKVREFSQNNFNILSNLHTSENNKNVETQKLRSENEELIYQKDKIYQEYVKLKEENQNFLIHINTYKEQVNQFILEIKQFQIQLDALKQESRLKTEQIHSQENLILNQKNQIDELVEKSYLELETGRYVESRIKELEDEKVIYTQKYENMAQNLKALEEKLSQIIIQLNHKIEQVLVLEDTNKTLIREKEQIISENNNYLKEINKLNVEARETYQKIQSLQENYNDSQKLVQSIRDEMFKLKQGNLQELLEKEKLIQEQKEKLRSSNIQVVEKSHILEDMTNQIQKQKDLQIVVSQLRKEKEDLELEHIKLLKDNEVLRIHLIQKQPENCQIEQILSEHNQILTEYHEEIQRLKEKLQQKQMIVDKFTAKIQKQSEMIQENEKEITNLQLFINNGKKQYEKILEDYQEKMDQMQSLHTEQQITLNNQIHLLMQDKQQMKSHLDQIQKEMSEVSEIQKKLNSLPSQR